jgi:hypothetical protein
MEAKSFNYNLLIISSVVTFIINLIEIPEMDSLQIKNLLGFSVSVSPRVPTSKFQHYARVYL